VIGINIEKSQLKDATIEASKKKLSNCKFICHNYDDDIDIKDADEKVIGIYDAIYEIQVFSLINSLEAGFAKAAKLLKPKGRLVCFDWVKLSKNFDETNAHHQELIKKIKPLIGAIETKYDYEFKNAMGKYFKIIFQGELDGGQNGQYKLIKEADQR